MVDWRVELTIVSGAFQALDGREAELATALARYVVLSRRESGCRNIDLVLSSTRPGRFVLWEKWDSDEAQRMHMASEATLGMAETTKPLVACPPELDIYEAVSAHDLA